MGEAAVLHALRAIGAAVNVIAHHKALGRFVHGDQLNRVGGAILDSPLAAGALLRAIDQPAHKVRHVPVQ